MMALSEFPCEVCGGTDAVEIPCVRLYTNDQPLHVCKQCGFVYVKARREAQEIADSWSNELFGECYTAKRPAIKASHLYFLDFLNNYCLLKNKLTVDIGAGEGQLLEYARDLYAARVYGIEPSHANCSLMREKGIDCYEGTIESYSASSAQKGIADAVTIAWSLETCFSCRHMLAGAWDILKDGGHIMVGTGSRILVPFRKALSDYLGPGPTDTHPVHFSANTLRALLKSCGFEPTGINRFHDTDFLCVVAQKVGKEKTSAFAGDDFLAVYAFFERWHQETQYYLSLCRD
jgi:SAM-dependent methyltransferase